MSEPRRKLSILVPDLPWQRDETTQGNTSEQSPQPVRSDLTARPDTKAWDEARKSAVLRDFQRETRWAGTD